MVVLATLFTEVFVRTGFFSHDSYTGAMLPHLANVALHKEARRVVVDVRGKYRVDVNCVFDAVFRVFFERRRARVVVEAADAADGLVFVLYVVVSVG